jgi:hypothetical protein
MKLTDEDIQEFAALWKKEFDEEISEVEARRNATQLLQLYSLLIRPPKAPSSDSLDDHDHEIFSILQEIN